MVDPWGIVAAVATAGATAVLAAPRIARRFNLKGRRVSTTTGAIYRESNEALTEQNHIFRDQIKELQETNRALQAEVKELRAQVKHLNNQVLQLGAIDKLGTAIDNLGALMDREHGEVITKIDEVVAHLVGIMGKDQ